MICALLVLLWFSCQLSGHSLFTFGFMNLIEVEIKIKLETSFLLFYKSRVTKEGITSLYLKKLEQTFFSGNLLQYYVTPQSHHIRAFNRIQFLKLSLADNPVGRNKILRLMLQFLCYSNNGKDGLVGH